MYILLLFIFILSIVIISFMVNDIFYVFKGKENLKENIENYIINTIKREDSLNLKKDILQNLRKETISLYDNIEIINKL